jgi:pimeloyl-ACP methyl ester carboxylesterase
MIALELASLAPRAVSRLALIAPLGQSEAGPPIPDPRSVLPFELPHLLFYDLERAAQLLACAFELDQIGFVQRFLAQSIQRLRAEAIGPRPSRASRFDATGMRAVLIRGQHDAFVPPLHAAALRALLPHAQVIEIPAAGHMVPYEKPEETLHAIETLLC